MSRDFQDVVDLGTGCPARDEMIEVFGYGPQGIKVRKIAVNGAEMAAFMKREPRSKVNTEQGADNLDALWGRRKSISKGEPA